MANESQLMSYVRSAAAGDKAHCNTNVYTVSTPTAPALSHDNVPQKLIIQGIQLPQSILQQACLTEQDCKSIGNAGVHSADSPLHFPLKPVSFPDSPLLFPAGAAAQVHVTHLVLIIHQLLQHIPAPHLTHYKLVKRVCHVIMHWMLHLYARQACIKASSFS